MQRPKPAKNSGPKPNLRTSRRGVIGINSLLFKTYAADAARNAVAYDSLWNVKLSKVMGWLDSGKMDIAIESGRTVIRHIGQLSEQEKSFLAKVLGENIAFESL